MSTVTAQVTPDRIMEMMWGYAPPLILGAAVKNRVFDLLDSGPKTVEDLAALSNASPRGLRAILNALVGFGFLSKTDGGQYALAPESAAFLVSSKPGYLGRFVEFSSRNMIPQWLPLDDVVRTGKPAIAVNDTKTAEGFFEQLVEPIFALSYHLTQAGGAALKLNESNKPIKVLDIGTGSGVWGIGLAQQSPQVTVTGVDWPGVLQVTRRIAAQHGVAERFSYIEGDFNTVDFGSGYDIVTLGHILHSEGEQSSRKLVRKIFDATAPGGKIVISEFLVNPDRTGPGMPLIFAVNMLVHTESGDTFSFEEISEWLNEAGYINPQRMDPGGPGSIIIADKPAD